jgi:hypothetical protein
MRIKNKNNAKSEVKFKHLMNQLIRVVIRWCVHNRLFNANFDAKLKKKSVTQQQKNPCLADIVI